MKDIEEQLREVSLQELPSHSDNIILSNILQVTNSQWIFCSIFSIVPSSWKINSQPYISLLFRQFTLKHKNFAEDWF